MEPKKAKADEKTDEVVQHLQKSRARKLRLPRDLGMEYGTRLDVMEALTRNRALTDLDCYSCNVCTPFAAEVAMPISNPFCNVFIPFFPQLPPPSRPRTQTPHSEDGTFHSYAL
jgi:uncharacterized protein (DUF302 family)